MYSEYCQVCSFFPREAWLRVVPLSLSPSSETVNTPNGKHGYVKSLGARGVRATFFFFRVTTRLVHLKFRKEVENNPSLLVAQIQLGVLPANFKKTHKRYH